MKDFFLAVLGYVIISVREEIPKYYFSQNKGKRLVVYMLHLCHFHFLNMNLDSSIIATKLLVRNL